MPNIKSAKKRVKTDAIKKVQNKNQISDMRTAIKKADALIKEESKDAKKAVEVAVKKIDKAVSSGLIHVNKAARDKSKLMKAADKIK